MTRCRRFVRFGTSQKPMRAHVQNPVAAMSVALLRITTNGAPFFDLAIMADRAIARQGIYRLPVPGQAEGLNPRSRRDPSHIVGTDHGGAHARDQATRVEWRPVSFSTTQAAATAFAEDERSRLRTRRRYDSARQRHHYRRRRPHRRPGMKSSVFRELRRVTARIGGGPQGRARKRTTDKGGMDTGGYQNDGPCRARWRSGRDAL